MQTEQVLLKWVIWTLLIGVVLGGKPWVFPGGGKYWIDRVKPKEERTDFYPSKQFQKLQSPTQ